MKSLGLALTIFSLTGALAALDMSGAHRVAKANPEAAQLQPRARAQAVESSNASAAATEAEDEADPVLINAFLVAPRLTPQAGSSAVAELRYD